MVYLRETPASTTPGWKVFLRRAPYLLLPNSKCEGSTLAASGNEKGNGTAVSLEKCADLCDYADGVRTRVRSPKPRILITLKSQY